MNIKGKGVNYTEEDILEKYTEWRDNETRLLERKKLKMLSKYPQIVQDEKSSAEEYEEHILAQNRCFWGKEKKDILEHHKVGQYAHLHIIKNKLIMKMNYNLNLELNGKSKWKLYDEILSETLEALYEDKLLKKLKIKKIVVKSHGFTARCVKKYCRANNKRSAKFKRLSENHRFIEKAFIYPTINELKEALHTNENLFKDINSPKETYEITLYL